MILEGEENMLEEGSHSFEVKAKTGRRKGLWRVTLEPEAMALRYDRRGMNIELTRQKRQRKLNWLG